MPIARYSRGTLRYYGLGLDIPIDRAANNYRYYSPETLQQVQFIKKKHRLNFSWQTFKTF
jgi:DNA-binding transcriptional MerR regulator